jgi:hypothetical protein
VCKLEDIRDFWIRSGVGREKYTLKSEHRLLLEIGGRGWFPIDKSGGGGESIWALLRFCLKIFHSCSLS